MPRLLLVEDDPVEQATLTVLLEEDGIMVSRAEEAEGAISLLEKMEFAGVCLDMCFMGKQTSGWDVLDWIRRHDFLPVLIITAGVFGETLEFLNELYPFVVEIVSKPVEPKVLLQNIKVMVQHE